MKIDADICFRCKDRYFLKNGICFRLKPRCLKGSTDICDLCEPDYPLTPSGECSEKKVPNCRKLGVDGECESCTPGAEKTQCTLKNWLDFETAKSSQKESEKTDTLQKNAQKILEPPSLVSTHISSSSPSATISIENCSEYRSETECERCDPLFVRSSDRKKCSVLPKPSYFCEFFAATETEKIICLGCSNGFMVSLKDPSVCIPMGKCSRTNPIDGKCFECEKGWVLVHGICQESLNIPTDCLEIEPISQKCLRCSTGMALKPICNEKSAPLGAKVKSPKTTSLDEPYAQCKNDQLFLRDRCLSFSQICLNDIFPGCVPVTAAELAEAIIKRSECLICVSGFIPKEGECIESLKGCSLEGQDGKCQVCAIDFFMNENGDCEQIEELEESAKSPVRIPIKVFPD